MAGIMIARLSSLVPVLLLGLAGCGGHANDVPGNAQDHQPFSMIAPDEPVHFTGTEPFWGGHATAGMLTWTTPEKPDGVTFPVSRFAGRAGLGFTGTLDGRDFALTVTEGQCSDGMSDRSYPFTASVAIGEDRLLAGCAWSDRHPATGGEGTTTPAQG